MESSPIPSNWLRNKNYIFSDKYSYMISEMKSYGCFLSSNANFHEVLLLHFLQKPRYFYGSGCPQQEETHGMAWRENR